ncbi:hypothetical protein AHAS_Ahas05G0057200 [Arachis hypogaea]
MVKDEWQSLGEAQFTCKLRALTEPLRKWHKENFRDMDKRLMRFEEELTRCLDLSMLQTWIRIPDTFITLPQPEDGITGSTH